ncbi:MAG: transglycosylase SLT domain-containing protein, partial [Campylobacterota bacterium]|nr:transglycosylase SLT domain-containing protein [Campylobacterota bacterium]
MRKYLILTGSLLAIGLQGCGEPSLDKIKKKIVKVETPNGKYTTVNKSSGAYGKYQIMPKTAKHYTKKLKMPHSKWKKPENQDKIFIALLEDNIKNL